MYVFGAYGIALDYARLRPGGTASLATSTHKTRRVRFNDTATSFDKPHTKLVKVGSTLFQLWSRRAYIIRAHRKSTWETDRPNLLPGRLHLSTSTDKDATATCTLSI